MIKQLLSISKVVFNYKFLIFQSLLMLLIATFCLLSIGTEIKNLIDHGIDANNLELLDQSILKVIGLLTLFSIFSFLKTSSINKLINIVIYDLRERAYKNMLMLKITYFEQISQSLLQLYIVDYAQSVNYIVQEIFSFAIRNIIVLICSIILMYKQSHLLTTYMLSTVLVVITPIMFFVQKIKTFNSTKQQFTDKISAMVNQSVENIKLIYSHNLQELSKIKFNNICLELSTAFTKISTARSLFFAFFAYLIISCVIFIIWAGAHNILEHQLTIGELTAFIIYSIMSVSSLIGIFTNLSQTKPHFEKLQTLFELIHNTNYEEQEFVINILPTSMDIKFENLYFAYPSRADVMVLNNFNAEIKFGQFITICGSSGIGKSTLAYLLLKFYNPTSGSISIAKNNLSHIQTQLIRQNIIFTNQEPLIFNASILDNITLGHYFNKAELDKILTICGIDQMLINMEKGLDTEVGNRASRLSGGQKQRICIARSLVTSPKVLILDEATNALDAQSEYEILTRIKEFMKNKTLILISHNTQIIQSSDNMINLNHN